MLAGDANVCAYVRADRYTVPVIYALLFCSCVLTLVFGKAKTNKKKNHSSIQTDLACGEIQSLTKVVIGQLLFGGGV